MDFDFLKKADTVTLQMEIAKRQLEKAKNDLDNAKAAYEEVFQQCEPMGWTRSKLKKITEDRLQFLIDSGFLDESPKVIAKEKTIKSKNRKIEAPLQIEESDSEQDSGKEQDSNKDSNLVEML